MSDLISRKMAIDAFVKYVADGYAESPNDFEGYMGIVKKLPPAQPERKKGKWIGYNTEQVEGCPDSCNVKQAYKHDLVEVVRCKDCIYFDKYIDCKKMYQWDGFCDDWARNTYENWYCSRAERRTNED